MSEQTEPDRFEYSCPVQGCKNSFQAPPVSNLVRCGGCGTPMEIYAHD